jgi:2-(1,2-epoxy-1,2-dihydrophenyl)acetyl-CoA isomerase
MEREPNTQAGMSNEMHDGGILVITLTRPESLNPFGMAEREAWNELLHSIESQAKVCRAVVFTGTGRAFSAGGDVKQFGEMFGYGADKAFLHMQRFQEMSRLVWRLPVPVIAAINGLALGGGTAIALMSDLRVASDQSKFSVGQIKRGFVPDVGMTYLLPRIIGLGRAMEMMLLSEPIDAQTALAYGLVNRVVPPDQVLTTAMAMARQLSELPEGGVRWIKRATYLNMDATFEQALNTEAMAEAVLAGGPDFMKSLAAFMNKP